jgi:acyl CoA:acetate/3-ketoacid CoA transferase beta subunit
MSANRRESGPNGVTLQEIMAVAAAREIRDGEVAFIGTGLPMVAAYLAKATHAPDVVLVFESGIVGAKPKELATGVGDIRLLVGCVKSAGLYYTLSLLQGGFIDIGFLGAAEVDQYGNLNSTAIGDYRRPTVRLPGSGGANDIGSLARRLVIMVPHERRRLVPRVQYLTTPGFLDGPGARERAGLRGEGPTRVITDLAVLDFDPASKRMRLSTVHPGATESEVEGRTGFPLLRAATVGETPLPNNEEVRLLRERIDPEGIYIGGKG